MRMNKSLKRIKIFFNNFKKRLYPKDQHKETKFKLKKPHSAVYFLLGERIGRFSPFFKDLDLNLQRSGLKISFEAYVSLTIFAAVSTSLVAFALVPILLVFVFNVPLIPALLFGVGGSLFAAAFSTIGLYVYPIYRADKLRRDLENELLFATGYMATLANAGVSPEKIFHSLSNLNVSPAVSTEAGNVVRDVNLFGLDIISALEKTSKRTPSELFRELLEGFISTIHSGGNLADYLHEKSRQYMSLKRMSLNKFSDSLSILSEFYVVLIITGSLLFVIMLAVMAVLGGGGLGMLSADLLLQLLIYLGIPLGSIVFLIILDATSPRW